MDESHSPDFRGGTGNGLSDTRPEGTSGLSFRLSEGTALALYSTRYNDYYESFIRSIPKNSKIRIRTNIPESEKTSLIRESKFLVRFGDMEFGPAIAVIESISCGTPVIINTGLGTADMIRKHNAGFVLDSPDPEAVANIVRNANGESYEQLLKNVYELRRIWTWKDHVEKLL